MPGLSETSRDRPNSAPYLRLKNSKRTSKCQSIGELGTLLRKKNLKKFSQGGPFEEKNFPKKCLAMPKNMKGGPFGLVRYCMLRGKPFWFSSLGQRVQFNVFLKF